MTVRCPYCRDAVDHCHGTLVLDHTEAICSDPTCSDLALVRHILVVDTLDLEAPAAATRDAA